MEGIQSAATGNCTPVQLQVAFGKTRGLEAEEPAGLADVVSASELHELSSFLNRRPLSLVPEQPRA